MKEFYFQYRTADEATPEEINPQEEYHSTFQMFEEGTEVENTVPLGNLLLHMQEGRIVGIEIFERANEILGTWKAPDEWEDDDFISGGRWFMKEGSGVYQNQSHAEIVAEDEGCEECGGERFLEERRELNDDKELLVDVKCENCGWVFDTVKR